MNKKLTVLSVLVLAIVISAYSVAGTYAKYTTSSDTVTDTARVAKWGLNFQDNFLTDFKLFDTVMSDKEDNGIGYSNDGNVVAPGAHGEYEFEITDTDGAPEVYYTVKFDFDGSFISDYLKDRLKFTLTRNDSPIVSDVTIDELIAALEDESETVYSPNDETPMGTYVLSWDWDFDDYTEDTVSDTELGNNATNYTADISMKVSAEQVKN